MCLGFPIRRVGSVYPMLAPIFRINMIYNGFASGSDSEDDIIVGIWLGTYYFNTSDQAETYFKTKLNNHPRKGFIVRYLSIEHVPDYDDIQSLNIKEKVWK